MAEGLQEGNFGKQSEYLKWLPLGIFLAGLFVLALGAGLFFFKNTSKNNDIQIISASTDAGPSGQMVVHVDGAVEKPGVYSLPTDSRIAAAVEAAGGLTAEADGSRINLAAKVTDGQKIHVAAVGEVAGVASSQSQGTSQSSLININTASESELDKLPGVGPVTANKIIASRPYSAPEDLLSRKVVSNSVYEKIKDLISL